MLENIKYLIKALKKARKSQEIGQSQFAARLGIPQSHISKIENGLVNVKLSSFVEIARTLGLEVMLVSKKNVPFVASIISSRENVPFSVKPAYTVDEEGEDE